MVHTSQRADKLGDGIAFKHDATRAVTCRTYTFTDLDPCCSPDVDRDSDLVLAGDASRPWQSILYIRT